jgi:hypothetical protein
MVLVYLRADLQDDRRFYFYDDWRSEIMDVGRCPFCNAYNIIDFKNVPYCISCEQEVQDYEWLPEGDGEDEGWSDDFN